MSYNLLFTTYCKWRDDQEFMIESVSERDCFNALERAKSESGWLVVDKISSNGSSKS